MTTDELIELLVSIPGDILWCFRDGDGTWYASLQCDALSPDYVGKSTLREALVSALTIASDRQSDAIAVLTRDVTVLEGQLACKRAKLDAFLKAIAAAQMALRVETNA